MIHFNDLIDKVIQWSLVHGIRILLILLITIVLLILAKGLTKRIFKSLHVKDDEQIKRRETLTSVFQFVFKVIIITLSTITILGEFGIEIGPILAAAGIVGLAIGFGAQNIVKDFINGFFIILTDQIRIGDVVEISGKSGVVEGLNLRMVILRDLGGNVHYVPNGEIAVVTNMTKDYSRYVFDIGVSYRENVDEVMEVIRQVDDELRHDPEFQDDILEPLEILGLDRFGESAVVIKARITTKPIKQWRIGREFKRRLKIQFDKQGIEIPYPHLTLFMGKEKQD